MSANKVYKVVVVGMGRCGKHHALAFKNNPRFELACICTRTSPFLDCERSAATRREMIHLPGSWVPRLRPVADHPPGNPSNSSATTAIVTALQHLCRRSASPDQNHVGSGAAIGVFAVGTWGWW